MSQSAVAAPLCRRTPYGVRSTVQMRQENGGKKISELSRI